jgi:hypothetical protein
VYSFEHHKQYSRASCSTLYKIPRKTLSIFEHVPHYFSINLSQKKRVSAFKVRVLLHKARLSEISVPTEAEEKWLAASTDTRTRELNKIKSKRTAHSLFFTKRAGV